MVKALLFISIYLSFSISQATANRCEDLLKSLSPVPVKQVTQTQIAVQGAALYFPRLFSNLKENLAHLTGLSDYHFFEKLHQNDPEGSVFRIFEKNAFKNHPVEAWSFPFSNTSQTFKNTAKLEFGYCSGITSTLRKFNMMATFESKRNQTTPKRKADPKEWFNYYKNKIDKIMDNQMTSIEGFPDLYTFTSDPEIQKYVIEKIVDQWQKNNVNIIQGVADGFMSVRQSLNHNELIDLNRILTKKLDYGYNPIVYLTEKTEDFFSTKQWIHVVMVTDVSSINEDGSFSIQVWDTNERAEHASQTIEVDTHGKMVYGYHELNMVKVLRWDDLEIERMIKKNVNYCASNNCAIQENGPSKKRKTKVLRSESGN